MCSVCVLIKWRAVTVLFERLNPRVRRQFRMHIVLCETLTARVAVVAVISYVVVAFVVEAVKEPRVLNVVIVAVATSVRPVRPLPMFLPSLCLGWDAPPTVVNLSRFAVLNSHCVCVCVFSVIHLSMITNARSQRR